MNSLRLIRDTYSRDMGTFGKLVVLPTSPAVGPYPVFECDTVERPWANNAPFLSCIPEGTYQVGRRWFHRGCYDALEVFGVPGRSHILIHVANTPGDVQGCIGVGLLRGVLNDRWAVLQSRDAMDQLMKFVNDGDSLLLTVARYSPPGMGSVQWDTEADSVT